MSDYIFKEWKKASGSCGYNVPTPVYGQQYRHQTMFAWENSDNFWTVSIVGLMSCGGSSLEDATKNAVKHIDDSVSRDYDRFMSLDTFNKTMNNSEVLEVKKDTLLVPDGWEKAAGSCGFYIDDPVYGRIYDDVAMFAWQRGGEGSWTISIVGVSCVGGKSFEEASENAIKAVDLSYKPERDEYMSKKSFDMEMSTPVVLGEYIPSVISSNDTVPDSALSFAETPDTKL